MVIPVFNRVGSLSRAIASVLDQSKPATEIIIVDDASTINLAGVKAMAEQAGCRWISLSENSGPGPARNRGVGECRAQWIAFLDSDDAWMPEKLERQARWHAENSDLRISQVRENWIRNGKLVKKPLHWEPKAGDLFDASCERCSIGPSCVMMRRDLWEESGGFDARFRVCEDYHLWLRICQDDLVGLVPGDSLVEKHGGHEDQLSSLVPAMDRYRVVALLEQIRDGKLSARQIEFAESQVSLKAGILADGAAKRRLDERARLYHSVAEMELTGVGVALNPVISSLWAEIEGS